MNSLMKDYGNIQDIQIILENVCIGGDYLLLLYHMDANTGLQL
jgi:hypothetical protein